MTPAESPAAITRALLESRAYAAGSHEEECRSRMLSLLAARTDCFDRTCFDPGHFTASALVVSAEGGRVLLHHHAFLDRWLQFGGHCDGDGDLVRVALREAHEESGIEGLVVASRRPFDLDIHPIPANPKRGEPPHLHFDVRFMLIAPEQARERASAESHALAWFTAEEARVVTSEPSMLRLFEKWQAIVARRR